MMRMAGDVMSSLFAPQQTPRYGEMGAADVQGRSQEKTADMLGELANLKADASAEAMIKQAKFNAGATRAQGAAAGQSALMGGLSSGISSLAGAIPAMGGSGGGVGGMTPFGSSFSLGSNAPTNQSMQYSGLFRGI